MSSRPEILITGASGFIGGHVARYFAGKGIIADCLVRDNSSLVFISDLPHKIIYGDITDYNSLFEAFNGKSIIVHIAGLSIDWGKWEDFEKINVTGTLNVLRAANDRGIRDVIITGSISSYGEEDTGLIKDETMPFNPHYPYFLDRLFPSGMNHYRDSKAEATRRAVDFATRNRMNLTVIEPVWVYGENEFSSGFYEYLKTVDSGTRWMPGSQSNNFHVIYAADLARAYHRAIEVRPKGVNRIIIGNESPEKMFHIFNLFCREAGLKTPKRLPRPLIYPLALITEIAAIIRKSKRAPILTRARVNMFYDNIGYSTRLAGEILGFRADTTLEEGIKKTVKWYKHHQHLKK